MTAYIAATSTTIAHYVKAYKDRKALTIIVFRRKANPRASV